MNTKLQDDDDEFFGNQSSDEEGGNIVNSSKNKVQQEEGERQHFHNLGYHQAYDEHKDDQLQLGFEDGMKRNMDDAWKIGRLLAACVFPVVSITKDTHGTPTSCGNNNVVDSSSHVSSTRTKIAPLLDMNNNNNSNNYHTATTLVRKLLETEQVRDGSNCDKNNNDLTLLKQNLEDIIKNKL